MGTGRIGELNVNVSLRQQSHPIDTVKLEKIAQRMLVILGVESSDIDILIVDNRTIAEINLRHLEHEGPTDIITFPISMPDDSHVEGEMIVSAPWAATIAAENGDELFDEIVLYTAHGILHLIGQDDIAVEDFEKMRRREFELLKAVGARIPRGRFDHLEFPETRN
jgi:probable rRNA maturation factor